MPYIDKEQRADLEEQIGCDPYYIGLMLTRGADLNWVLYSICLGMLGRNPRYDDFEPVIMALEGAKFELLRRKLAILEDDKIGLNGDVHGVTS